MKTATSSELRANLSGMMDMVNDDHAPLMITRAGGRPAVLVSAEDWSAMEETLHLLRSPRNAAELHGAIAELDAGEGVERDLTALADE